MAKKKKSLKVELPNSSNPFSSMLEVRRGRSKAEDFPDEKESTSEEVDLNEEFSILSEVRSIINDKSIVARDMKIDDSSMPRATSYWDWVTGSDFLGDEVNPYLEQALIGIKLFAEYCPHCSDTNWMKDENHKPQEGLDGIRKNVVVLVNGVCPECKAKRSKMLANGELNFYNELAVNAGQRCVVGETIVSISHDKAVRDVSIKSLIPEGTPEDKTGFVKFDKPIQVLSSHGFVDTDRIFISRPEQLWEVKLKNGSELVGTKEHPVYCDDSEYANDKGWTEIQKLVEGDLVQTSTGWSKVISSKLSGRNEYTYDLSVPEYHEYFANGILSHNSGKSIVVAMLSTYITHRVLMMQKPTEIYNVGANQMLHGTFVALTAGQAKDTLYEPYYGYILDSPWFKKYHALLDNYQRMYGQVFYKIKDTYIQYRHRNLLVYFAGPDKRVLRGRTRIFASVDEIGWFDNNKDSGKVKIDATQVYIALERSLLTCRLAEAKQLEIGYNEALSAYFLNISSPSSVRDKICELVRVSEGSQKILGLHKPSWEMNPNIRRDSPVVVEAYRVNPIDAERDYGANPPLSVNPFMTARAAIQDCLREVGRNLIVTKPRIYVAKDKDKFRYAEIQRIKESTRPSVLSIDAGYTNNSFALTCGSLVDGVVTLDLAVEIQPLAGIPLHYTLITENILKPIIEKRNVCVLLADRWNSIKLLQDMEHEFDHLKVSKQYSVKYSDLWNLKAAIEGREVSIPRMGKLKSIQDVLDFNPDEYPRCFEGMEIEHLILQMLTVQDTGKQVLKGDNLTDDIWRAMVLMHWGLINPEYQEYMVEKVNAVNSNKFIGSIRKGLESRKGGAGNKVRSIGSSSGFVGVRSNRK